MAELKRVYFVHHSHTDIGYTDAQEVIISRQVEFIKNALKIMRDEKNGGFKWNCETFFCVERFLEEATDSEKEEFFERVRQNRIGISGTYLNFTDLAGIEELRFKAQKAARVLKEHSLGLKSAMNADINGISMGQRDALIDAGVEFLFMNIHACHGKPPMWRNQIPFKWVSKDSSRELLVFSGEHYNLGNFMGFKPCGTDTYANGGPDDGFVAEFDRNMHEYYSECESDGYSYPFLISGISGVFSDNAPPNVDILRLCEGLNRLGKTEYKMVTLDELYEILKNELDFDALPRVSGDMNDWWASGIGSIPYAAKHYRAALRNFKRAKGIAPDITEKNPHLCEKTTEDLLLFAEHTFGHSASVSNPFETMVYELSARKIAYATNAFASSVTLLEKAKKSLGAKVDCYGVKGTVKAVCPGNTSGRYPVNFYIETPFGKSFEVKREDTGERMGIQCTPHPRGTLVTFIDEFEAKGTNLYGFNEIPSPKQSIAPYRSVFAGSDGVRDIINDEDKETFNLPYRLESERFKIEYSVGRGFTSFFDKAAKKELLNEGEYPLFTPVFELTKTNIIGDVAPRSRLGRNIRGTGSKRFVGKLISVDPWHSGTVFSEVKLGFELAGTRECAVILRLYKSLPRIEARLLIAKELPCGIESIFLPITPAGTLNTWLIKGSEAFKAGVDQLPGSCMDYYVSDDGAIADTENARYLIGTPDVPLLYAGRLEHHAIRLCDNRPENGKRPVYSWVMNNVWETNFSVDQSGCGEFLYTLMPCDIADSDKAFEKLESDNLGICTFAI